MSVHLRRAAFSSANVNVLYPILALLLSVFAIAPLWYPGFFQSHTGYAAVYNVIDLDRQLGSVLTWTPTWGRAFDLFRLEKEFAARVRERLSEHPLIKPEELKPLDKGLPLEQIETMIGQGALPLFVNGGTLVGAMRSGHDEDDTLTANVLLENLACKASGAWAMRPRQWPGR